MADRDESQTNRALDDWVAELTAALEVPAASVDRDAVLGLAGTAARAVVRPAAPLTTFLVGYAAGRAAERGEVNVFERFATIAAELANRRPSPSTESSSS